MEKLVHVVLDVLGYVLPASRAMSPHVVRDSVQDVRAQGLSPKLSIRHLRGEHAVLEAMGAEAVAQPSPLPLQPHWAPEVVLYGVGRRVAATQLAYS